MNVLELLQKAYNALSSDASEHSFAAKEAKDELISQIGGYLNEKNLKSAIQSYGQKAVGLPFNPSGDDAVGTCEQGFATLIDQMNDLRATSTSQEQKRLASVAITEAQGAQMWAVKSLTWKD